MSFFDRVKELVGPAPLAKDRAGDAADPDLQVATATLLLETAYGDHEYVPKEHEAIRRGISRLFGLSREEASGLMDSAEASRKERGTDLASISSDLRERFDHRQRTEIINLLWKVIFADQIVDEHETELAGHVTELAGLTPEEGLEARRKAFQWFSTNRPKKPEGESGAS